MTETPRPPKTLTPAQRELLVTLADHAGALRDPEERLKAGAIRAALAHIDALEVALQEARAERDALQDDLRRVQLMALNQQHYSSVEDFVTNLRESIGMKEPSR